MSRNGKSPDAAYDLDHVVPLVTQTEPLPATAEVAIIGGGIMGASIAYHLAEAGVRDVLLIERNRLGSGSSAKPLGGVRATFSDAGNVQLGLRSLRAFERFGIRDRHRHRTAPGGLPVPVQDRGRAGRRRSTASGCRTRSAATAG